MFRKTVAHIDLHAIRENFLLATTLAPKSKTIAVVKANAYGHGMLPVVEALREHAPAFALATIDEALELRAAGITQPLLVMEGVNDTKSLREAAANNLSLVVHCEEQLRQIIDLRLADTVPLWLKIDTGMHRLGLAPERLRPVLDRLGDGRQNLVVCTHLACADDMASATTQEQLDRFAACVTGIDLPISISNSAGILAWPASHGDWNRPGYMLYGASPMLTDIASASGLRAAMSLRSEIIALAEVAVGESVGYGARWTASRPSLIGTVAIGYADGYPRHAADGTPTLVNGQIAPLIGTVSMDMLTIDLTGQPSVAVGDAVELWGQGVCVNDVAKRSETIGYELMTGVSERVPRHYTSD